ncbi:hypothetical protein FRC01_006326, partial [Tulasnella sp. 417]
SAFSVKSAATVGNVTFQWSPIGVIEIDFERKFDGWGSIEAELCWTKDFSWWKRVIEDDECYGSERFLQVVFGDEFKSDGQSWAKSRVVAIEFLFRSVGKLPSSSGANQVVPHIAGESPEPPVPPLPANVQSMVEQADVPIGMAATSDEPVQVSKRVNRSRASSVTNQDGPTAYNPTLSSGRTSWGGHPPPPHLAAQRSSEWGPLPEDDGEVSVSGTSTDLEGDADLEEDEGDHTYNPAHRRRSNKGLQNNESLADSGLLPDIAPDVRPISERTARYSAGSSIADENEWETDESGMKSRKPPVRTDAEATDVTLGELKISNNPLRTLPPWLSNLKGLQIFIADFIELEFLPNELSALSGLQLISLRNNNLHSLPGWLCSLNEIEWLLVDNNPFLAPWQVVIGPLTNAVPPTPGLTPRTPFSAVSGESTLTGDSLSPPQSALPGRGRDDGLGDQTITLPSRLFPNSGLTPTSAASSQPPYHIYTPSVSGFPMAPTPDSGLSAPSPLGVGTPSSAFSEALHYPASATSYFPPTPVRAMTSTAPPKNRRTYADGQDVEVLRVPPMPPPPPNATSQVPSRFDGAQSDSEKKSLKKMKSADDVRKRARAGSVSAAVAAASNMFKTNTQPVPALPQFTSPSQDDDTLSREKGRKWGFLKKMSMGKMRAAAAGVGGQETIRSNKSIKVKRPSTGQGSRPPSEFGQRAPARQFGQVPNSVVDSAAFYPPGISPSGSTASLNAGPKAVDLGSPALIPPPAASRAGRRRSFLPLDGPPQLNIPIDKSPLMSTMALGGLGNGPERPDIAVSMSGTTVVGGDGSNPSSARQSQNYQEILINVQPDQPMSALSTLVMNEAYAGALRTLMVYLRDLFDLGGSIPAAPTGAVPVPSMPPSVPGSSSSSPMPDRRRRPTLVGGEAPTDSIFSAHFTPPNRGLRSMPSTTSLRGGPTVSTYTADSGGSGAGGGAEERKVKDDKAKRAYLVKEIVDTERTYVKQLQELIDIYINPSAQSAGPLSSKGETIVPGPERRIVFNGLEALFSFHMQNFLPALERKAAPLMSRQPGSEVDGEMSARVARDVAQVFVSHAAFMRMYSTYINNFDNCLARLKQWTTPPPPTIAPVTAAPTSSTAHVVGLGLTMSAMGAVLPPDTPTTISPLTNSQRKRIKEFLKRSRRNPKHSQLNLEGYLLLPVQRIPRYKLLLEQLVSSTPPRPDSYDDPIEKALEEISSLAMNMNEGKRESESRKKLVQWQTRIGGSSKFPSPLVQPHRRLIMDGTLKLSKVARKKHEYCQSVGATGEATVIQVEFLEVESTPRDLAAILCNDLLVLCKDPSKGKDKHANVDLWAVLRMQTLPQPASIVNGRHLRLVDHKAIMYFEMTSTSDALTWSRAINMHIPASRA